MPAHYACNKLIAADLEKVAEFYKSVFGLVEQARVRAHIEGRGVSEILFEPTAPGGATFVLMAYTEGPPPAFSESINLFIVPDVDGQLDKLRAVGGRVTQDAADMPQHGVRVAFARDVEGHLIEIVQPL